MINTERKIALDVNRDKDIALKIADTMGKAGKKISFFQWKSNIIAKVCSKELVVYIQSNVEYGQDGKNIVSSNDWPDSFKYGFIAGLIDSDGHVHEHLGTEIITVSSAISKSLTGILKELGIPAKIKRRDTPKNSFSKKPRFEIYIPSAEMKLLKDKIPSVKIARFLARTAFSEKD